MNEWIEAMKEQHNPELEKLKKKLIRENKDLKREFIELSKILEVKEKFIWRFQTNEKKQNGEWMSQKNALRKMEEERVNIFK